MDDVISPALSIIIITNNINSNDINDDNDTNDTNGRPKVKVNIGLTWSGYRPSDDKCKYGYHIPDNLFAVVALHHLHTMATALWNDEALATAALELSSTIKAGVAQYGTKTFAGEVVVYCYEVDGFGGYGHHDSHYDSHYDSYCEIHTVTHTMTHTVKSTL